MWIEEHDIYLISEETLKEKNLISKNVDSSYIIPAIKTAQDIRLTQLIGHRLVEKLCLLVFNYQTYGDDIPDVYRILLNQYIHDYLMYQVRAEIEIPLWGKAKNEGVINAQGTEFQQISRNDVNYIVENWRNQANALSEPIVRYLDEHRSSIPEWQPCKANKYTSHLCL